MLLGLGTGPGALPIFLRKRWSDSQRLMFAVAGGMMLGATFFSLLQPALAQVRERGGSNASAATTVAHVHDHVMGRMGWGGEGW